MTESRLEELLVEWEIAQQEGRDLSPEELASGDDALVESLREQIEILKATSWMLSDSSDTEVSDVELADDANSICSTSGFHHVPGHNTEWFISAIENSQILTQHQVEWLNSLVSMYDPQVTPNDLAARLIEKGFLTSYQAKVLLEEKDSPLVLDRYVILGVLGAGGMGVVYKAQHRAMERIVALKILPRHAIDSPEKVTRFRREIRATARLDHPNIVLAYDAHEADGNCFLVMEYVEGSDLKFTVSQDGRLPPIEAATIVAQMASALDAAHSAGIIHRDVKPSNILLSVDGVPKLLDLGLARLRDTVRHESSNGLTREGLAMGTAAYMAPEQARDPKKADARSDIYSLGCTLYFLLFGKPVFEKSSSLETILAHMEDEMPSIVDDKHEIPEALDEVFQRMVARDPKDRYANMREVRGALLGANLVDRSGFQIEMPAIAEEEKTAAGFGDMFLRGYGSYLIAAAVFVGVLVFAFDPFRTPATEHELAVRILRGGGTIVAEENDHRVELQSSDLPLLVDKNISKVVEVRIRGTTGFAEVESVCELEHLTALEMSDFPRDLLPLQEFAHMDELISLAIVRSGLVDGDLKTLGKLKHLERLDLSGNKRITDAGVSHLSHLGEIKHLNLSSTELFVDRGLRSLGTFDNLEVLKINHCGIGDRGLSDVLNAKRQGNMPLAKLREIELAGTNVSVGGLKNLAALPNLSHLKCDQIKIESRFLEAMRDIKKLRSLDLSESSINDAQLKKLEGLKTLEAPARLEKLDLTGTKVSPEGIASFQAELRYCEIVNGDD